MFNVGVNVSMASGSGIRVIETSILHAIFNNSRQKNSTLTQER